MSIAARSRARTRACPAMPVRPAQTRATAARVAAAAPAARTKARAPQAAARAAQPVQAALPLKPAAPAHPAPPELASAVPVSAPPEGFEARVERALGSFALPSVAPNVVRQLVAYCDLAVTWNQRVDLTAARSPDELVDLLLAD